MGLTVTEAGRWRDRLLAGGGPGQVTVVGHTHCCHQCIQPWPPSLQPAGLPGSSNGVEYQMMERGREGRKEQENPIRCRMDYWPQTGLRLPAHTVAVLGLALN